LMPSLEVGKAEYDGYFRNGLLVQLRRLKLGEEIEEAHMRNRAWICNWVMEQAAQESNPCVQVVNRDGKTFIEITNYEQVRTLFAKLLKEVQRITSEGDYRAAQKLADGYGKKVNAKIHQEVLNRSEKLNIPPYNGFMNPVLVPETDAKGNIKDVQVTYMDSFAKQMLMYSEQYGHLK